MLKTLIIISTLLIGGADISDISIRPDAEQIKSVSPDQCFFLKNGDTVLILDGATEWAVKNAGYTGDTYDGKTGVIVNAYYVFLIKSDDGLFYSVPNDFLQFIHR